MAMRFWPLFILFTFCLFACKDLGEASDPTLARVENSELRRSELLAGGQWDSLSMEERTERVENWISRESVYEQALAEGVADSPEVKALVEDAKKKIVLGAYLARVTDTIKTTDAEVAAYYAEHPERFLRTENVYDIAVVTYESGTTAWKYYAPMTKRTITEKPAKSWLLRNVETFDSVTALPADCPRVDLKTLEVGKITRPASCGKSLKSLIVLSRLDSGAVLPFADVAEQAQMLAASAKRKAFVESFRNSIKKKQAIFIYPEEIAKPSALSL